MRKRHFLLASAAAMALQTTGAQQALQPDRVGLLMLHGKNPGGPRDPNIRSVAMRFEREGMLVELPDMPWSSRRYIDGHWDRAMEEMDRHVATLRSRGATRIVLMGHSIGCTAALAYAVRKPDVDAIVLLAPGHIPRGYYEFANLSPVRKSIDEARALVAAGKGDERAAFNDINQGRSLTVRMTARDYLSYFDPLSDAEMGVSAPRVSASIPVLTVIGSADPLFRLARLYVHDKLPSNTRSRYLEVTADHLSTPEVARDQVSAWIVEALARG
jgi:pimeloyl-ACP methyl ester carboxylesterase